MPPTTMHEHISDVLVDGKTAIPYRMQRIEVEEPVSVSVQSNEGGDPVSQHVEHYIYDQNYLDGRSHSHTIPTFIIIIICLTFLIWVQNYGFSAY
jgi:hypothetical protein